MATKLYATPRLVDCRTAKNLTQTKMARLLGLYVTTGVSPSLYQKWEQGTVGVNAAVAVVVAEALEEPIESLWEAHDDAAR